MNFYDTVVIYFLQISTTAKTLLFTAVFKEFGCPVMG